MSEYKYKPYSRTREIVEAIGEIVGMIVGFGLAFISGYILLAVG